MSPNEKEIRVVSGSEDNTVNVVNDFDLESEKQNSLLLIYKLLFLRFF